MDAMDTANLARFAVWAMEMDESGVIPLHIDGTSAIRLIMDCVAESLSDLPSRHIEPQSQPHD